MPSEESLLEHTFEFQDYTPPVTPSPSLKVRFGLREREVQSVRLAGVNRGVAEVRRPGS